MPGWKDLCELLHNEDMDANDIIFALGVKPFCLRRMLQSKRLESHLELIEAVANRKAGHAVVSNVAPAVHKMTELIRSERPETARKACLDVIEAAMRIYKREKGVGHRV